MDERIFHAWLRHTEPANGAVVPLGDDAAVIDVPGERVVVCTDSVAEGTHFLAGTDPAVVGAKAAARNLSDLAAMGAKPLGMLVALVLPRGCADEVPQAITRGLREACATWNCPVLGGDTSTHDGGIIVNVTMLGVPMGERVVTRSGANAGDVLVVTGQLGGSQLGRHLRIVPRIHEALALLNIARPSAMIDISDGLLLDLERLADASACGYELNVNLVPVHADAVLGGGDIVLRACTEGEDFELLFALCPEAWTELQRAWSLPTALTQVGHITANARCVLRDGKPWKPMEQGHVHR
ncbi:MAG: thiamine-phosphate kinase [Planctomycetes bacterium]|nr:thiamine-phosphate kinase [Planctomycetota bacterium]